MALPYADPSRSIDERVADLVSRMSEKEKLAQLSSIIIPFEKPPVVNKNGNGEVTGEFGNAVSDGLGGVAYLHMGARVKESVRYSALLQRHVREHTRLGIPLFFFEEALTGFVAYESTQFPSAQNCAATFDPMLVESCFDAIGREARARGANVTLAPVADIGRDPRWGRVQETFGEDTFLVSRMIVAAVRGLQGGPGGPHPTHMAATLKHFAGFGQSEGGRQMAPVHLGRNALNNEILPSFRAGIQEGGAAAVMPAYHEIDGVPCHANGWLLDTVLRKRWGFNGLVVADFGGIQHLVGMHGIAPDIRSAALLALRAGVDMDLPEGACYPRILSDILDSPELRARFECSVRRVLECKMRLGLFENPYPREDALSIVSCDGHQELSLRCGEQSVILLKNDGNLLPLDKKNIRRIACIGPHADLPHLGEDRRGMITILEGIRRELGGCAEVLWARGCALTTKDGKPPVYLEETAGMALTDLQKVDTTVSLAELYRSERPQLIDLAYEKTQIEEAVHVARNADVVLLCLGESSWCIGENYAANRRGDRDDIGLIGNQLALFRAVRATGTPLVVILAHTRTLVLGEIPARADAILDIWDPGERRGTAVARIVFGLAEPGGRLPVSVPVTTGQIPCYYSRKPTGYARTYAFRDSLVQYPFGYGLAYTTFSIDKCAVSKSTILMGEGITVQAEVTNAGKRAGTAVVQVYLGTRFCPITRPVRELKAFCRVLLAPGESRPVSLIVPPESFSYVDVHGDDVIPPGQFTIGIGFDSENLTDLELTIKE